MRNAASVWPCICNNICRCLLPVILALPRLFVLDNFSRSSLKAWICNLTSMIFFTDFQIKKLQIKQTFFTCLKKLFKEPKTYPGDTYSSIYHLLDIEIPHRKSADILSIMKGEWIWHRFDVDNLMTVRLLKLMEYRWLFHVYSPISFWGRIDVNTKLAGSFVLRICALITFSALAIYSKVNFNFKIWNWLPIQCNFNIKLTCRSNIDTNLMLK